jgi:hypothetical protein
LRRVKTVVATPGLAQAAPERRPFLQDLKLEAIQLPREIESKSLASMKVFGLAYGAFDFIVMPDRRFDGALSTLTRARAPSSLKPPYRRIRRVSPMGRGPMALTPRKMLKLAFGLIAALPVGAGAIAQTQPVPSPGPAAFVCPRTRALDCMPIVPEERRALCGKDYRDWARKHCPGLQIVY